VIQKKLFMAAANVSATAGFLRLKVTEELSVL
jgi:hypothetical protein